VHAERCRLRLPRRWAALHLQGVDLVRLPGPGRNRPILAELSHIPESKQCGWRKDRFGISSQIVPADMNEHTRRTEQIQVMMQQKKTVIAELETA
jgi:predicted 3-demethylubiquinone-9 3-methyltransferase (glyoxalase superfamily)